MAFEKHKNSLDRIVLFGVLVLILKSGCINERSLVGLLCDSYAQCPVNLMCDSTHHCVLMDKNTAAPDPSGAGSVNDVSRSAPSNDGGGGADVPTLDAALLSDASSASQYKGPADASTTPSDAGLAVNVLGCDSTHPTRVWPSAADTPVCFNGSYTLISTTGPNAPNWTIYNFCASTLTFTTTIGKELRISTWGDGCDSTYAVLWHIAYDLEENTAEPPRKVQVEVPDSSPCVAGKNLSNIQLFTPQTTQVEMVVIPDISGNEGFYYQVCTN